jgi:hypothetical protein
MNNGRDGDLLAFLAVSAGRERNARHSVVTNGGQAQRDQTCNDKLFKHFVISPVFFTHSELSSGRVSIVVLENCDRIDSRP